MPDIPAKAITAAAEAIERELMSGISYGTHVDADEALARAALNAAAPILAEAVAQKILDHAERQHPRSPDHVPSAWHRHFSIAARVAASSFSTDEELKRSAAEAIARGDFAACQIPEDGDG